MVSHKKVALFEEADWGNFDRMNRIYRMIFPEFPMPILRRSNDSAEWSDSKMSVAGKLEAPLQGFTCKALIPRALP